MKTYQAVIGYTEDPEIAMWGAGITSDEALIEAVERFIVDQSDYIEPGDYEATVYDEPLTRMRDDDGEEVYAWLDRGTVTVSVSTLADGFTWTASPIVWDGVAVTP